MPADTHDGAVVSSDHAGEDSSVEHLAASSGPRTIAPDEVREHNGKSGSSFWAVVDGFVVDATAFIDTHPGGLRKLMSTDDAGIGAGPDAFSFSFSRGRNVLDQCQSPPLRHRADASMAWG